MEALIPNKDSLFDLLQIQKKILQQLQNKNPAAIISPVYPLYAFAEKIERDILKVIIEKIDFNSESKHLSFSLKVEYKDKIEKLKIDFGKIVSGNINEFSVNDIQFSVINLKILRLATVTFENNSWQVFDEKWIKLK